MNLNLLMFCFGISASFLASGEIDCIKEKRAGAAACSTFLFTSVSAFVVYIATR